MTKSRTKNVSINVFVGLFCQIINLIVVFVSRTFFIKILGREYLGVNGLFSNILTILSFAELGIGNAIVFSMYKPLAIGDEKKIASLMWLYKKTYIIIGIVVAVVGLFVTPFLKYLINDVPNISDNIYLLYILFLTNTVVSYFFVYKKSIFIADQKNYITILITQIVHILQIILQIIFLFLTHNYIVYLILQIGGTIFDNLLASILANKNYPFLKKKADHLPKEESKHIFKNVKSLAIYKFGSVILNGTDNIIVSIMFGVATVGIVSNYTLIITACTGLLVKITDSFISSVGNLNAICDEKKQYEVFTKVFFITSWIYGFVSVGLITIFNSFINTWVGHDYILELTVVIAIVLEFYVKGVHSTAYTFRTTLGLFEQGKYSALIASVLNLVFSIVLCKLIGLAGIFIATPLARVLSLGIVDPLLIFKRGFKRNPIIYYTKYIFYTVIFIAIGFLCYWLLSFISLSNWIGVITKILIVTVIFNGIMLLIFYPTKMFKEILKSVLYLFKRKN